MSFNNRLEMWKNNGVSINKEFINIKYGEFLISPGSNDTFYLYNN